jgi:uncharacterized membrane protein YccC
MHLPRLGALPVARLAPARAARVALGVVLPLVIGWLCGDLRYGAYAALGALPAGFSSFQGETRSRVAAVALASAGMALSTFVGGTVAAASPWLLVPVVAAWGYLTGLSVCLEPRWSVAILQWSVALLIAVGLPVGPSEAAVRAGFVLAGGLLQALLVAASWALRPGDTERNALAASFDTLSTYARQVSQGAFGPPPPAAFPATAILADPNPLLQRSLRLMLVDLLEEAERVRVSLAALAAQALDGADAVDELRALMAQSAAALGLVADTLRGTRDRHASALRELDARVAPMAVPESAAWRWSGETLLGQLRAVARTMGALDPPAATSATPSAGAPDAAAPTPPRWQGELAWSLAMLRANVGIRTEAGRHAVRLAVVVALAEAIVQATGLYQGRWAALTVFIVLKPDHASTFTRGLQRALGTVLGAAAGGALVDVVHRSHAAMVAAAGICIAIAYAAFDVSYMVFALFLTMFVVALLAMLGFPVVATAEARIVDTLIGAALSLIAYAAWPTREAATAHEKFARLVEAHRDYTTGLLGELAHPGRSGRAALGHVQAAARRARSDAEAAATRLADERATRGRFTPDMARQLIAAISRLAHAELALHALALSEPAAAASWRADATAALVDELGSALGSALGGAADALRAMRAPAPLPAVRPIYSRLAADPAPRDGPLVPLLDRVIDAAHTIDAIVRERFRAIDA